MFALLFLLSSAVAFQMKSKNLTLCETQFTLVTLSNVQDNSLSNPLHLINLHRNENTSIAASRAFIQLRGGYLHYMKGIDRLLSFTCAQFPAPFVVDPNRMFTRTGITASLLKYGSLKLAPDGVVDQVEDFAKSLLSEIGFLRVSPIIAVHNNGANGINAKSFQAGGEFANDARLVSIKDEKNVRDFFLTTQRGLYTSLSAHGDVNVVLASTNATDDGSLSYYCTLKKKLYVNVEAAAANDHDGTRLAAQVRQLAVLGDIQGNVESCGQWKMAAYGGGGAALLLSVLMVFLSCLICRQRGKAAGYETIDGQYSSY